MNHDDLARTRIKRIRKPTLLRIGCWNVTSYNNKDQEILLEIKRHKLDICALSETKKKGKGNSKYDTYILIYSGKDKNERAASGVGILIHEKFEDRICNTKYINDRLLQITMELQQSRQTHIISIYAPDINKPKAEIDIFYQDLQTALDDIPKEDEIMILGDFNARIGDEVIPGIKNRFNEETINTNGELMLQLCTQNELRINNTFYPHKPQHKYTFENTRGQKSMIDYIITNRNIHPRRIQDVRTLASANAGTNHHLIMAKIRITTQKFCSRPTEQISKLNIESLNDNSVKYLYQRRLKEKITTNNIREDDDIETAWTKLRTNILGAAEEALGRRIVRKGGRPNTKPWFKQEVKTLAEEKRKSYLLYRSRAITYDEYKVVRNRINENIQKIKREHWERFSSDMEHDLYGGQKKIWNLLRSRKKPINEYIQSTRITSEEWEKYFEKLYSATETKTPTRIEHPENDNHPQDRTIPLEKIQKIVTKLKNRKAPGIDEITNEMIKHGGDALLTELQFLFNKILAVKDIPSEWRGSILIPIFKKGEKTDPKNYRGISLMSAVMKLFTKILAEEVVSTGICEEQQGFRNNRSAIDAIFIIRQITEKAIEFSKVAFMCFVDLTQAFDRVRLADVLALLQKRNIHPNTIRTIEKLNTDNYTYVRTANKLSKRIPVKTGIRQGDSLSPVLFNIIMDEIVNEVKQAGRGYRMGDRGVKIICYADDAVIVSEDEDDLQRLLYKFQQTAQLFNMQISVEKTKSLAISKEPKRCKLAIYDRSVEQVMSFKYLGASITSARNLKEEVKAQTTKASVISGCLRDIIWRNKYMSNKSKVRIYKTCVRPIMTYAIETRAENTTTKRLLRTTEMRTLRSMSGFTLLDRKRNEEVREMCEVQDVVRWARGRRREWRDHVNRMPNDRLAKIAKDKKPNTPRPPGRPPTRWYESWSSSSQQHQGNH